MHQRPRINTIAPLDQFQRIQISAKLKQWLLTTIRHYSHHSYYSLFATTVRYSLFGFSRHPNTNECCRRLQALAAASLIQFQLEKKNDPVHLLWMLYRQASRHTKTQNTSYMCIFPTTFSLFSWLVAASLFRNCNICKMHKVVRDVTGRHYNARNSDVSLPRPPRGKGKKRIKFRLVFCGL